MKAHAKSTDPLFTRQDLDYFLKAADTLERDNYPRIAAQLRDFVREKWTKLNGK